MSGARRTTLHLDREDLELLIWCVTLARGYWRSEDYSVEPFNRSGPLLERLEWHYVGLAAGKEPVKGA